MIQRHTILLNPRFSSGTTAPEIATDSALQDINQYQVNNIQGLGGGVVNEDNIRGFLNDENNERIINDFFSYLTASTTTIEFAEIWNSDLKIATVFNEYYESSVINNQVPSGTAIVGALTGTTGITVVENMVYNYDGVSFGKYLNYLPQSIDQGTRNFRVYSALTTYSTDESYYVPVHIKRSSGMMDRQKFFFDNIQAIIEEFQPDGGGNDFGDLPEIIAPLDPITELDLGGDNDDGDDGGDFEVIDVEIIIPPGINDDSGDDSGGSEPEPGAGEPEPSQPSGPISSGGGSGTGTGSVIGGVDPGAQTRN